MICFAALTRLIVFASMAAFGWTVPTVAGSIDVAGILLDRSEVADLDFPIASLGRRGAPEPDQTKGMPLRDQAILVPAGSLFDHVMGDTDGALAPVRPAIRAAAR